MAGGSVADLVGYFCFLASICSVHEKLKLTYFSNRL